MRRILILAVICLLCFTGCSKRKENNIEAQKVTDEVQQTETETEALQTTETEPESEEVDVLSFYEWEVTNDGIKITNYKGNEERVVMPSIIDNKMVVEMKSGAFNGNVFMKEFVARAAFIIPSITCLPSAGLFPSDISASLLSSKSSTSTSVPGRKSVSPLSSILTFLSI